MKCKLTTATLFLSAMLLLSACSGKDNKTDDKKETTTETTIKDSGGDDNIVPSIDTASLKDEASILDAMQKVADARLADDKKKQEDPNYSGHYLELTKLYTAVLKASTAYSKTLTDPNRAVEFNNKVSEIQKKMYAK